MPTPDPVPLSAPVTLTVTTDRELRTLETALGHYRDSLIHIMSGGAGDVATDVLEAAVHESNSTLELELRLQAERFRVL